MIRIPESIKLVKEENVSSFSPRDRLQYYDKVIVEVLRANVEGVTAPEIEEATGFYGKTVRQHLARLVERGEAISVHRGKLTLYFPNGEVAGRPLVMQSKLKEGVQYVVSKLKNRDGISYYIQQKELDAYRALRVKGGIMISADDMPEFIKQIHTFALNEGL